MKIIHYEVMQEVNFGTGKDEKIEKRLHAVSIGPMSDDVFESNYAIAVSESYNGEVTVEDIPDENIDPTVEERLSNVEQAMDALLGGDA